ncbi:hypothetical protein PVAP13_5NG300500 [Panicum virgatum]|uniref:Uncharacterized protein n=1 Tax=Panicum virgatum TaxID=38727 RepID=A0A8T0RZD6_PANVG|nr:hypothetical protein PVAP13_5NG300500 [Panicum virgatum]
MQAGRVLSQARWANPRRKPVKRRSSARIAEAALCGVPARPSGAVSPQKERTSRDREAKGREGVDLRSRSEGAGAPPPAGLTCVRPWRRRLARRRPLACCCHQLPMDPQLPAIRSRLFSPLHENNEKSVQVSAAMVCPKSREGRLEQGRQLHKRKQRRQEQQDRTPPQETSKAIVVTVQEPYHLFIGACFIWGHISICFVRKKDMTAQWCFRLLKLELLTAQ